MPRTDLEGRAYVVGDPDHPIPVSGPITDAQLRAAAVQTLSALSIPAHDYIALTYTGDDLTGVVYKTGGAGGTMVATLTLAYSGGKLASVTKS